MKIKQFLLIAVPFAVIVTLLLIQPDLDQTPNRNVICFENKQTLCRLPFNNETVQVEVSSSPLTFETFHQLTFIVPEGYQALSAVIVGINMDMGQIPLVLNQEGQWVSSEFAIGICAEPEMLWQIQLSLQSADGKASVLQVPFITRR